MDRYAGGATAVRPQQRGQANRADANRAADLAYNSTVLNGPASWKRAYPLRVVVENVEAAQQLLVGERPGS
jgi:hypothetical protein